MAAATPGDRDKVVVGVVLAAGSGRRFGSTKQLALLAGRPLVAHVVTMMATTTVDEVVVVVGHDAREVGQAALAAHPGATIVLNPRHSQGMGTSLAAAASAVGRHAMVVVLADQPGITATDVDAVVAIAKDGAVAARLRHPDGPGHPVALSAALHDQLVTMDGDDGARRLLDEVDTVELEVSRPRPPDIDTPETLRMLETKWPSGR